MGRLLPSSLVVGTLALLSIAAGGPPTAPNGIAFIRGYQDWKVVAPSYRPDKDHIRLIYGNDTAVRAMESGTRPFPDGTVLVKVAWSTRKNASFPAAVEPGKFAQVEFMIKDAKKYAATGGWGFARFLGPELKPYGDAPTFVQECFGCHIPVKDNDFVFTSLVSAPR